MLGTASPPEICDVRKREMRVSIVILGALLIAGCCARPECGMPDYSRLQVGMTLAEAESAIGIAPWHWQGHIYSKPVYSFDSDRASAIVAIDHSLPEGRIIWVSQDQHGKTISEIRRDRQK
jgi:hypothetical protein